MNYIAMLTKIIIYKLHCNVNKNIPPHIKKYATLILKLKKKLLRKIFCLS